MKVVAVSCLALLLPVATWAVYAPAPEAEQGQTLVFNGQAGLRYDTNVLGSYANEQSSAVLFFGQEVKGLFSLADQTFLDASYGVDLGEYFDRPGQETLINHEFQVTLDHTFDPRTFLTISDHHRIIDDPEAILVTLLQGDQSYQSNAANAHFQWGFLPTIAVGARVNRYAIDYDDIGMAELDREDLGFGTEIRWSTLPTLDLVLEQNYTEVSYDRFDAIRGSETWSYLLGGDYRLAEKLSLGARLGWESRERNSGRSIDAATGNLSLRWKYLPNSDLTFAYAHELRETTVPQYFPEQEVDALYLTFRHDITGHNKLFATGSLAYERSTQQARESLIGLIDGVRDIEEDAVRLGLGLIWRFDPTWGLQADYDLDYVTSEQAVREQTRHRASLAVHYTFGN